MSWCCNNGAASGLKRASKINVSGISVKFAFVLTYQNPRRAASPHPATKAATGAY
jgi:hypothetical protein